MNYKISIFFLIVIYILFQCENNETGYNKAFEFYIKNKNNTNLKIFSKSSITPFRHLCKIDFNIYFDDYNIESIDNLKAQLQNKENMLYMYIEKHNKDKEEILNYIHKIYSNYHSCPV